MSDYHNAAGGTMVTPTSEQRCTPGVAVIDWDGVLRAGFLVFDWAHYLTKCGQFENSTFAEMAAHLKKYHEGELTYSDIAESIPRLYAVGLAGRNVEMHTKLARAFVETRDFIDSLTWLADIVLGFIGASRSLQSVIISGAPQSVLEAFVRTRGVDAVYGLRIANDAGAFGAQLIDNPAVAMRKLFAVHQCRLSPGVRRIAAPGSREPLIGAQSLFWGGAGQLIGTTSLFGRPPTALAPCPTAALSRCVIAEHPW